MSWRRYFRRSSRQDDLQAEIESYLAITIEDNIAAGMTEEQARSAAYRKFGNVTHVKETVHEMTTLNFLEER